LEVNNLLALEHVGIVEGETMMQRLSRPGPILSLIVFLVMAVALVGSFLSGALTQSVAASTHPQVLKVFAHLNQLKTIPVGTPSDKRGTYLVFQDSIFDATDTHQIGYDNGTCVYTTNTILACSIVFIFHNGEIAIQGPETLSGATTTTVITGGTGIYTGAKGQELVRAISNGTKIKIVFQFA
jgi:hypothetical protein